MLELEPAVLAVWLDFAQQIETGLQDDGELDGIAVWGGIYRNGKRSRHRTGPADRQVDRGQEIDHVHAAIIRREDDAGKVETIERPSYRRGATAWTETARMTRCSPA